MLFGWDIVVWSFGRKLLEVVFVLIEFEFGQAMTINRLDENKPLQNAFKRI